MNFDSMNVILRSAGAPTLTREQEDEIAYLAWARLSQGGVAEAVLLQAAGEVSGSLPVSFEPADRLAFGIELAGIGAVAIKERILIGGYPGLTSLQFRQVSGALRARSEALLQIEKLSRSGAIASIRQHAVTLISVLLGDPPRLH